MPQKKIGDRVYELPYPGGLDSFVFQERIIPVATRMANVFLHFLGTTKIEELAGMDVLKVVPEALPHLGRIFGEMPHGEMLFLTRTLLGQMTMNKMPMFGGPAGDAFQGFMQGRTIESWQLMWFALEVWYPDFFAKGRSFLAPKSEANPSSESSTSDQPGPVSA